MRYLELTIDRIIKDKIDVEIVRFALDQALRKAEETPAMRIVDSENEWTTGGAMNSARPTQDNDTIQMRMKKKSSR